MSFRDQGDSRSRLERDLARSILPGGRDARESIGRSEEVRVFARRVREDGGLFQEVDRAFCEARRRGIDVLPCSELVWEDADPGLSPRQRLDLFDGEIEAIFGITRGARGSAVPQQRQIASG